VVRWLRDDAGNPAGIHGVARDITERRRAEDTLRTSQEKYATIFNYSMDAIFLTRPDGTILDANPAACEMFDLSVEEIRKRGRKGLVDSTDPRLTAALQQRKDTGTSSAEFRMIRANDEKFPVECASSIFTTLDGEERTSMIIRDITERKRAEESLKRHAERLQNLHVVDRAILQGAESPEVIAQTALQHLTNLLNCQCASAGIFSPGKDGMLIVASVINGATNPRIGTIIAEDVYGDLEILREGNAQIVEDASGAPASSPVCVFGEKAKSFIKVPLRSKRGMIGVLLVGWNHPRAITLEETEVTAEVASQIAIAFEHARLRRESECHEEELEQRVKERTAQLEAFSYSVSHDLRAPLRALSGYTQILMDEYSPVLDDEGKRVCGVISDSARNMGALIDDLLAFSRISRAEISISSVDMAGMVESIFLESTTPEERERIDLQIGRLPPAQGDTVMLRHVWTNLLGNAIKFSSKKKRAVIKVSARRRGAETVYTVRDNGAGFDMQYAGKLFGVFQRLHSAKEFEGTGIGLAIVRSIIERHGGQVWAEGRVGKGATFHFTLYREE
jgi:PAS domain S-box-containing protein